MSDGCQTWFNSQRKIIIAVVLPGINHQEINLLKRSKYHKKFIHILVAYTSQLLPELYTKTTLYENIQKSENPIKLDKSAIHWQDRTHTKFV